MSRLRLCLIVLIIPVVAVAWWVHRRSTTAPDVAFAKVRRETLVSTLDTNGKVEPSRWVVVRATRPGIIRMVHVENGDSIPKGAAIAELDSRDASAALSSAEASLAGARSQAEMVRDGGASTARVDIDNEIAKNRAELAGAQKDYEALKRLVDKQAATRQELTDAGQRIEKLKDEIAALERKRAVLVTPTDRVSAQAKVDEAKAAAAQARLKVDESRIVSPMAGVVYNVSVRDGAYVNIGDPIANVGIIDKVRVRVYVDEPELGRVSKGMAVTITWDAMPNREWKGEVEKLPTEVVALNTRQVGEVVCTIGNSGLELIPGTNVNAEIVSQVVNNGLTIPKEAIHRRPDNAVGVYLLNGDHVEWRPVTLGATSITRAAVTSGLEQGNMIALTTEQPLVDGQRVNPIAR